MESADSRTTKNQERNDYADERVPVAFRTWSTSSIFGVMFGVTTAMIFLSWGGVLVTQFGTMPLVIGMVLSTVFIGGCAVVFSIRASKTGLGAEMLSRSSGFGHLGSIPVALIFALAMIMYFAFEGGIMVNAIHAQFTAAPKWVIILVFAALILPLTIYGMKAMNVIMWVTLPIYIVFMIITIVIAIGYGGSSGVDFWSFQPDHVDTSAGPPVLQILAASLGYATQVALSADTGRLIDPSKAVRGSFLVGGLSQLLVFMVCTLLGAWLALQFKEADPGIYLPAIMGIWGVLFVVVTQLRINVVNIYSSSISLTTIGKRISSRAPNRSFWVVVAIAIGTIAMLTDLYSRITSVMAFAAIFLLAWVMTIVADLLIVRKILKIVPDDESPYRNGELPQFNPVGLTAVGVSVVVGVPLGLGAAGAVGVTLAPFVAGVLPLIVVPVAAALTRGRTYRNDERNETKEQEVA